MGRYKLIFRKPVARDLRQIRNEDVENILATIESLSENPRPVGAEKLSGAERYRVRQGHYRIIYEILEDKVIIVVVKVKHREDVYRRGT